MQRIYRRPTSTKLANPQCTPLCPKVTEMTAALEVRRLRRLVPGLPRRIWTLRDSLASARASAQDRLSSDLARQFVRAQLRGATGPHLHVDPIDVSCLILLLALVQVRRISGVDKPLLLRTLS